MAQSAWYSIDDSKLSQVFAITQERGKSDYQVEDFILANWREGDEHQEWLNTASPEEIADWVLTGLKN